MNGSILGTNKAMAFVLMALVSMTTACTPPVPETDPKKDDSSDWSSYNSCIQYQTLYGNPDACDRVGHQYGSSYNQYSYGSNYGSSYGNGYGATPTYGSRVPYSSNKARVASEEVGSESFKTAYRDYLSAIDLQVRQKMVHEWRILSGK